jgi:hypothetical protein
VRAPVRAVSNRPARARIRHRIRGMFPVLSVNTLVEV